MNYDIPNNEKENVLSVYWQMLRHIECQTRPERDPLDAHMVKGAYDLLNRIGVTTSRPQWESKANASPLAPADTQTPDTTPVPNSPQMAGCQQEPCCPSLFSPDQIEQWLTHMESIASASPQMAAVIRMIRRDVQHPEDGIAALFQHNIEGQTASTENDHGN